MKKLLLASTICLLVRFSFAQYINDIKLYRTVSWQQLCKELQGKEQYLLLDVRSKGEFADTSGTSNYNMGHLKGAKNISLNDLPERLAELEPYKSQTIYVHCSHSQRSRRASKLLSENGFKNVVNINGGMTQFNLERNNTVQCGPDLYETSNSYTLLSPSDVCKLLVKDKNVFILDVRKDSVFMGIATNEKLNANGHFNNAVNIPSAILKKNLNKIPPGKQILVVDDNGDTSPDAAKLLLANGLKNVAVLFNGMQM